MSHKKLSELPNRRPILLVDMDDTLNHCTEHWLSILNKEQESDVQMHHISNWNGVAKILAEQKDISFEEALVISQEIFTRPGFFYSLTPYNDAIEYLHQLHNEGYKIKIVTKVPTANCTAIEDKKKWILDHLTFWDDNMEWHFTSDKHLIEGDILIDDSDVNIAKSEGIHITMTLDKPWNKSVVPNYRCTSWKEIYKAITSIHEYVLQYNITQPVS